MVDKMLYGKYTDTTLHTNYYYIRENALEKARHNKSDIYLKSKKKLESKERALRDNERAFYNSWGCKDEKAFFELLKVLQNISKQDQKSLQCFTNFGAQSFINKIIGNKNLQTKPIKEEVTLTINTEKLNKPLNDTFKKYFNINNKMIKSSGEIDVSFTPTPQAFKVIFNALKQTKFQVRSFNYDILLSQFDELAEGLDFRMNEQTVDSKTMKQYIPALPFPWGYTNEDIVKMVKEDPSRAIEIEQEFTDKIIEPLKAYCKYDNASNTFRKAFDKTLAQIIDVQEMFMGGKNWKNALIGAMGEFGNGLIFNYVDIIAPNSSQRKNVIEFVGNERKQSTGEKRGVDLLTNGFGIQVKNYSLNVNGNNITRYAFGVKQHPEDFGKYLSEADRNTFYGFIANYFFNPIANRVWNRGAFESLKTFISENLQAEVMALTTEKIEDRITFFNISNTYFIPGSALLKFYRDQMTLEEGSRISVSITSSIQPYGNGLSRTENEYWEKEAQRGNIVWKPTEINLKEFQNAIRKNITIEAKLNGLLKESFTKYQLPLFSK